MTDKKIEITSDVLLADVCLRLTAIEKLLLDKKILTKEELVKATEDIAQKVAKVVLEKVQGPSKEVVEPEVSNKKSN